MLSVAEVGVNGCIVKTMKKAKKLNLSELASGMYLITLKLNYGSMQTL